MSGLDAELLLANDLNLIYEGALSEQLVGQELLANQAITTPPELYYWARDKHGASAEIDYLVQIGGQIIPIEVKSGKSGRLKSMQIFLDEHKQYAQIANFGIKISQDNLQFDHRILSIPFYMLNQIDRIVKAVNSS